MNSFVMSLLMGGAPGGEGGNPLMSFLPLIAIVGIFYFLILRPQSKKQKETQKMLSALKKGDRVITVGGIHGVIYTVKENTIIVKVDDNVKLEFNRSAISNVSVQAPKEEKEEKSTEDSAASSETEQK